ncbi:hypothetical protein HPP92_006070 [Vanilla planifolia]|uniref:BTB domain-containing protein n=1 Tax=Vanilla planifolia TaxID=51239 RepID=A0A835RV85_VANPL|nr:hypothetical protein HPP92_006070 [Vanilla planifolia]
MADRTWCSPKAPPFLCLDARRSSIRRVSSVSTRCVASESIRDLWDRLFTEGYRADVCIHTNNGIIPAHASILGTASPVFRQMLRQSRNRGCRKKAISIRGVPHHAVYVFLRFLYSSCYEKEEMNQYVMHLLVLSHVFGIPSLKKVCVQKLEKGLLTLENVVDAFQLGELCDAPRLSLLCHRMIVNNFQAVSATDGWKAMRQSNPSLEKDLVESVVEADCVSASYSATNTKQSFLVTPDRVPVQKKREMLKKMAERKTYLQLHEAMQALVHICRDGCRTIGPHDKVLKRSAGPCSYPACRGLESLVRHFASCKKRVLGGCGHCRGCGSCWSCTPGSAKRGRDARKDEVKWKLLVSKVLEAKICSTAHFRNQEMNFSH